MSGSEDQTGSPVEPTRLRNIGIVAHINAGKTTLTERILFDSGRQRTLGDVDAGTATMDWLREEQERGISISAALTAVPWHGFRVQIVDTPGHVDFAAEVERCLRVLDGAIVVLDGVRGVETQTETVWRSLDRLGVPRLVFVNKLDRPTADFDRCVAAVEEAFGVRALPLVVPLVDESRFVGLVDAVGRRAVTWDGAPAPDPGVLDTRHQAVLDECADRDDTILADFVQGRVVAAERLHGVLRRATLAGELVPVFAGSALHNRGVEPLLDGVCRYLPTPLERRESAGDAQSLLALVFKAQHARDGGGPEALVRVFRGRAEVGQEVESARGGRFRLGAIQEVHAMERSDRTAAGPGEIVAMHTPHLLSTGETLRSPGGTEVLEPVTFSVPVLARSIEPRSDAGLAELVERATALAVEDPTLEVDVEPDDGGIVVRGMGELHLEVFAERLARELSEPPRFGRPAVVTRETVAAPGEGDAECIRQLGERTIRARASVRVEPLAEDEEQPRFRWVAPDQGATPELRAEVLEELAARAGSGFVTGDALGGVAVEVAAVEEEGPTDMVRPLLHEAVALACRRALQQGGLQLSEPWLRMEVVVPVDATGPVLGNLLSRGARIDEVGGEELISRIRGRVPLAGMLGYATELRSMTRGRGRFELTLEGFRVG